MTRAEGRGGKAPLFSIITPVYDPPIDVLKECIGPRLDAYLAIEVERAVLQLTDNA